MYTTHTIDMSTSLFQNNTTLKFTNDPMDATHMADAVLTDTWVSMGQEEEKAKRVADFAGYQVNNKVGIV